MQRLEDMRRRNVEVAFVHQVILLDRLDRGKGELDGEIIHLFQRGWLAIGVKAITLGAQAHDLWIVDQVFPGEDDIIGGKGFAIRPLGTFDQVHGQFVTIFAPLPALGQVGEGFHVLVGAVERARLDQRLVVEGHRLDAKPTRGDTGAVVPASRGAGREIAPDIAIDANAVGHTGLENDLGLLGQAFGHWRQFACCPPILSPMLARDIWRAPCR